MSGGEETLHLQERNNGSYVVPRNINVPGVTQSILKAAAGQQLAPGDTKHLSTMIDPITKALTDPVKSKKLSDIFRMP